MVSQRSLLAVGAALLWALGLCCVWRQVPIIPAPQYDIENAGRIFLLNGALAVGVVLAPSVFIVRDWLRSGRGWRRALEAPMLWAFGGLYLLALNAASETVAPWLEDPRGSGMQDTIYVVAHLHYVLSLCAVFALFAAVCFWFARATGRMYSQLLARLQFGLQFAGANFALLPLLSLKMNVDMLDFRHVDRSWDDLRILTGIGAALSACGMLLFAAWVVEAFVRKRPVAAAH